MKPSILTRFAASTVAVVVAIVATIGVLVFRIVQSVFNLPMAIVTNVATAVKLVGKRLEPRETNAQINARMLADPEMADAEFLIVADSGKKGDEDRKLPFRKGFLETVGLHDGQRVGINRAEEVSKRYLVLLKFHQIIQAAIDRAEGNPDLTKPNGRITSDAGCP